MRKIAMLLTLCLLATMLPCAVFADEVDGYIDAVVPELTEGDVGGGLTAEPEGDAPVDPEESDEAAPEQAETPADPSPAEVPAGTEDTPAADVTATTDEAPSSDVPTVTDETPATDVSDTSGETPAADIPATSEVAPANPEEALIGDPEAGEDAEQAVAAPEEDAAVDPAMLGEQAVAAAPHTDPNGPQLASNQITLGVGESYILGGAMPAGLECAIAYKTSNAAVADVGADGVVVGVAPGDAVVTATAESGAYAECFVTVLSAPDTVAFAAPTFTMGKGEQTAPPVVVVGSTPGAFAGKYTLTSNKPKVVAVEANGELRAIKTGKAVITVQTYNGCMANCKVTVLKAPKKVTAVVDKPVMGVGEMGQVSCTLPKKTAGHITCASENPGVVTVDAVSGAMYAVGVGSTRIVVTTFNGKTSAVGVTVKDAPTSLSFASGEFVMGVGMVTDSAASVNEGAGAGIAYQFSNPAVAVVENGAIRAVAPGESDLVATTYNGLSASCKLIVKPKPAYVRFPYKTVTIGIGESLQLTPDVGDSASTFTYTTSAKKRVSVTADGVITGLAKGKATITVKTYNKKKCKLKVVVRATPPQPVTPTQELPVDLSAVTLAIPARTTGIDGISANLAMIDAIRVSAIGRINAMQDAGIVTEADANKRRSMVNNAFVDYAFPWMTPAYQVYWNAKNSEGGVKDFKPDIVYYGLPYISGTGTNRLYNVARALGEGRYTDSGAGYYLLNQGKLVNKKYCGCDCSAFVNAAIWGVGKSHSTDRTTDIAKSSAYKTLTDYNALRTGDLICKSDAHVVMFLYYAAEDRSKMMIIENGGIEPGTNTVHCIVMDTAYYVQKGYSIRRLATLG